MLLALILLPFLIVICLLGPGFFLLKSCRFSMTQKTIAALGTSYAVIAYFCFFIFWFHLPFLLYTILLVLCVAAFFASFKDIKAWVTDKDVQSTLKAYGALLLWAGLFLCAIQNYAGPIWYGDWYEHYQRSLFYLYQQPSDTLFLSKYTAAARPPIFNLLCGFFMFFTGDFFEIFMILSLALNLTFFFPALSLYQYFSKQKTNSVWVLLFIFALNPMVIQNATFTWSKQLMIFFCLSGIYFYLRSFRVWAFILLALGFLTHYAAGPIIAAVGLHYLYTWIKTQRNVKEFGKIIASGLLILIPWYVWVTHQFGLNLAFSNTASTGAISDLALGKRFVIFLNNIIDTIIFPPFREMNPEIFNPKNTWANIKDHLFILYQQNALIALGIINWIIVIYFLVKHDRQSKNIPARWFWVFLIGFSFLLGLWVQPIDYDYGLAQNTPQILVMIALCFLASQIPDQKIWLRYFVAIGLTIDACLGIFLHMYYQGISIPIRITSSDKIQFFAGDSFCTTAYANGILKFQNGISYIGDHLVALRYGIYAFIMIYFIGLMGLYFKKVLQQHD